MEQEQMTINKTQLRKDFHTKVFRKIVYKEFLSDSDRQIFKNWVDAFKPNMNYFTFFKDKRVLFNIVKYLGNSELCINENIRWLYSSKSDYLLYIIYFYQVLEKGSTFYTGLANYSRRERPPFGNEEKREWQKWWSGTQEYLKYINGFKFGLDIDGKTFKESYKDAKKVFDLFKKHEIKFSV